MGLSDELDRVTQERDALRRAVELFVKYDDRTDGDLTLLFQYNEAITAARQALAAFLPLEP